MRRRAMIASKILKKQHDNTQNQRNNQNGFLREYFV